MSHRIRLVNCLSYIKSKTITLKWTQIKRNHIHIRIRTNTAFILQMLYFSKFSFESNGVQTFLFGTPNLQLCKKCTCYTWIDERFVINYPNSYSHSLVIFHDFEEVVSEWRQILKTKHSVLSHSHMKWIFCVLIFFHPPRVLKGIQFSLIRLWLNKWFVQFHVERLNSNSFAMPKNLWRLKMNYVWLFIIFACKNRLRPESVKTYGLKYTFWANNSNWTGMSVHIRAVSPTNMIIHQQSIHLLFIRDINFRVYSCEIEIFICSSN